MRGSECRLLNIMIRDLKIPNDECAKILNTGSTLNEIFRQKINKWKFEKDNTKYISKMRTVNDLLQSKGMSDTVFRDPENYEMSFDDFHYFFSDKTIQAYIEEEENRCLVATQYSKETEIKLKTIFFGEFYQSDSLKKEPIEWSILKSEENRILILSRYCLDCRVYYKDSMYINDWSQSDIRNWLNNDFYNDAFSDHEKSSILNGGENTDKIFLLDQKLTKQFILNGSFDLKARPSQYALNNGARTDSDGFTWWWLASSESNVALPLVPSVSCRGSMGLRIESNREGICVRPAMWINM